VHVSLMLELGVQCRLLKSVEDPLLWMEVYENIVGAAAFEKLLGHKLAENGIDELLPRDKRKIERFHS
jgi:Domain of unknown function (DUF4936)